MSNTRSLCTLFFALGAALMLFVCTVAPNPQLQVQARELPNVVKPASFSPDDFYAIQPGVNSEYEPIQGEPVFGDRVNVLDEKSEVLHACVYIADGFVVTKNRREPSKPLSLMKLDEMLAMHGTAANPNRVVYLRRKQPAKS